VDSAALSPGLELSRCASRVRLLALRRYFGKACAYASILVTLKQKKYGYVSKNGHYKKTTLQTPNAYPERRYSMADTNVPCQDSRSYSLNITQGSKDLLSRFSAFRSECIPDL
jgi:hypothetical protein